MDDEERDDELVEMTEKERQLVQNVFSLHELALFYDPVKSYKGILDRALYLEKTGDRVGASVTSMVGLAQAVASGATLAELEPAIYDNEEIAQAVGISRKSLSAGVMFTTSILMMEGTYEATERQMRGEIVSTMNVSEESNKQLLVTVGRIKVVAAIAKEESASKFYDLFEQLIDYRKTLDAYIQAYKEDPDASLISGQFDMKGKKKRNMLQDMSTNAKRIEETSQELLTIDDIASYSGFLIGVSHLMMNMGIIPPEIYAVPNTIASEIVQRFGGKAINGGLMIDSDNMPDVDIDAVLSSLGDTIQGITGHKTEVTKLDLDDENQIDLDQPPSRVSYIIKDGQVKTMGGGTLAYGQAPPFEKVIDRLSGHKSIKAGRFKI